MGGPSFSENSLINVFPPLADDIVEQEETDSVSEDRVDSVPIKKSFVVLIHLIGFTTLFQTS